jgi:hypothetical protein
MRKKLIGIYFVVLGISGIALISSIVFMVYNLSDIKSGKEIWFNYIFIINMYAFITLLVLGAISYIYFRYIKHNK